MRRDTTITKEGNSFYALIPQPYPKLFNLKNGSKVLFIKEENQITIIIQRRETKT